MIALRLRRRLPCRHLSLLRPCRRQSIVIRLRLRRHQRLRRRQLALTALHLHRPRAPRLALAMRGCNLFQNHRPWSPLLHPKLTVAPSASSMSHDQTMWARAIEAAPSCVTADHGRLPLLCRQLQPALLQPFSTSARWLYVTSASLVLPTWQHPSTCPQHRPVLTMTAPLSPWPLPHQCRWLQPRTWVTFHCPKRTSKPSIASTPSIG